MIIKYSDDSSEPASSPVSVILLSQSRKVRHSPSRAEVYQFKMSRLPHAVCRSSQNFAATAVN